MQRVSLENLRPGMVIAANVYSADGRLLVRSDVTISEQYLIRLAKLNITSVYVRDPFFVETIKPEIVNEEIRLNLIWTLKKLFVDIRSEGLCDCATVTAMADTIVGEVCSHPQGLVQLTDIRLRNEFLFGHVVNVALLCTMIGRDLGYSPHKLHELALGGLLHDVGQLRISQDLLSKPTDLTAAERRIIQAHTLQGFDLLWQTGDFSPNVMLMALQHHERINGSGYPQGLRNEEIREESKIVAVADVYDAMTSDRPHRRANFPHETCLSMVREMGTLFDTKILSAFLMREAIYPVGSVVLLSTGQLGVVTQIFPGMQNRPIISLIYNETVGIPVVDLRNHPEIEIQRVLLEEEVFSLGRQVQDG